MGNTSCCCSCSPSQEDYQDFISKMVVVEEMSHIDELISYIDQLLNAIDEGRQVPRPDRVDSSIESGGGLLEKILKRSNRHICKRDIMPKLNRETRKFAIDVTNQAAHIKWVGVALSVVGFVLERIEQISSNRKECIEILRYKCNFAKYIKQLDEHLPQEKLNRVLQFIVEGSLMCISQMKSDALSKFFAAPVAAEDLRKFQAELGHAYQELSLEAIITVLNRIPVVLPPSQGRSPQAVGIEEARNRVTELLDMNSKSVRVVVIYGHGGIGKTTLATAVFSKLNLKNYKYCRVDIEQNCSEADLKLLQCQILRDLFGPTINLRSLSEGREELSKAFKKASQPVFIFVDNALKQNDLEKFLPINDLASLPAQSRILATTRNLNETHIILQAGIELRSYPVASLPQEEARKLLCEFALGSDQASFDPTIDIKGLLKICQGIPLVLKIAGAKLRAEAQSVRACRNTVEYLKSWLLQGAEGEISEQMVDFVYNRLEASCKEAFLDIVFFFCNWKQNRVAFSVGEVEFQELQRAALVNITDEGTVNVHDIVKARGRMLSSDGERITNVQSLTDVLQDVERIKKTKGISLDEPFELEACHLNLMKRCLRVLILRDPTKVVNGECKGAFENLRLLSLDNHYNYSQMDVSKHPRLAVFIGDFYKHSTFCEFSGLGFGSSLKYMYIYGATLHNLTPQLHSLCTLTLWSCRGFDILPETIRNLPALEILDLENCDRMLSLSDNFGNLSSLKKLNLKECSKLVSLPDNFGNLSSLKKLKLKECSKLVSLPDSFVNLSSLKKLSLKNCSSLVNLPNNFGNLIGLEELDLCRCSSLVSLPDSIANLSSLKELCLNSCSSLVNLPNNFGKLFGFVELDLTGCPSLVSLPDEFANLSSLKKLKLNICSSLVSLPDSFGNLSSLKEFELNRCSSLVSLPDSFGNLSSLKELNLSDCSSLMSLPDSFGNLSSLKKLNLSYCSSLMSLPDSFGNLFGLVKLLLYSCTQLSVLPESFRNLSSVELLILTESRKLSSLPQNFGQLKCLKFVSIHGCRVLQSFSGDFECLSSLIAIRASECSQLEENAMDKLAKMKGLMIVDIDGSPMLEKRWEQVKEQYSLAVVSCKSGQIFPWNFSYADVMGRALFHSESKFLHVDENGQFGESPCPTAGVKLWFLLTVFDLTSPSNNRWLEAAKKKWMEVDASERGQLMYVEMGGSWEESERRVRQGLPHLPSGTTAWIAPDNRARLLFAYSALCFLEDRNYYLSSGLELQNCIMSTSTCVDEEGRRMLDDFDSINLDTESRDNFDQIFSPVSEATKLLNYN